VDVVPEMLAGLTFTAAEKHYPQCRVVGDGRVLFA
jgi:hypothetical protein